MNNEAFLAILSSVFTAGLGLLNFFTRKLVRDMEKKIEDSQFRIARAQDKVDDKLKEKHYEINVVLDKMNASLLDIDHTVRALEKNMEVLTVMTKNSDERFREKVEILNKNQEQIAVILQKLYQVEQRFGAVVVKKTN